MLPQAVTTCRAFVVAVLSMGREGCDRLSEPASMRAGASMQLEDGAPHAGPARANKAAYGLMQPIVARACPLENSKKEEEEGECLKFRLSRGPRRVWGSSGMLIAGILTASATRVYRRVCVASLRF